MVKNQEIELTFQTEGPIIVKMCTDVPTLQGLCLSNYARANRAEKRLIRERKLKNQWKQRALDLGYGEYGH